MGVPLKKVVNGGYEYASPSTRHIYTHFEPKASPMEAVCAKAAYQKSMVSLLTAMACLCFLVAFVFVGVKVNVSRINWQIGTLSGQNQNIKMENERIKGEIAHKKSLDRIEKIAVEELGMIQESKVEYMVLSATVTAEGKVRPQEEMVEKSVQSTGPVAAIFDFLRVKGD